MPIDAAVRDAISLPRGRPAFSGRPQGADMATVFSFLVPLATGAVLVVLLLGLANLIRGGSPNRSQTLMRWRVGLQFVAIVVIMAALWVTGR
jgi:hypothetical protein